MKDETKINHQEEEIDNAMETNQVETDKMVDKSELDQKENPKTATETPKKKSRIWSNNKEAELKQALEEEKIKVAELNDKFLRLYSEFDNFRKRTNKEKLDLYKTAGEDVIVSMLPILDDFERALKHISETEENKVHREGVELIYNKFSNILKQKGVELMDANGNEFNTDLHEALTKIPAPTPELKGKVVDVLENGYLLNGKVIRFAKVVVGD
jgi:molecular chaperone GrpE